MCDHKSLSMELNRKKMKQKYKLVVEVAAIRETMTSLIEQSVEIEVKLTHLDRASNQIAHEMRNLICLRCCS